MKIWNTSKSDLEFVLACASKSSSCSVLGRGKGFVDSHVFSRVDLHQDNQTVWLNSLVLKFGESSYVQGTERDVSILGGGCKLHVDMSAL